MSYESLARQQCVPGSELESIAYTDGHPNHWYHPEVDSQHQERSKRRRFDCLPVQSTKETLGCESGSVRASTPYPHPSIPLADVLPRSIRPNVGPPSNSLVQSLEAAMQERGSYSRTLGFRR